jgi:hypothetical protein
MLLLMKHIYSFFALLFLSSLTWSQCTITYSVDSIPASCAGTCDGAIVIAFANGGAPAAPYNAVFKNSAGDIVQTHTFLGESGTCTFDGACAEEHTVSIQSIFSPSCFYDTTITVTEPAPVVISSVNVVHETSGMSNGSITINGSGGIMPYLYSIDGGDTFQASNLFAGLDAGLYNVVVQDDNGCSATQAVGIGLIVTTGCEVVASATPQATSCAGACDGEIQYDYENLQMGTPGAPYTVTIEDSDGNVIDSQVHPAEAQSILFPNLCAGIYTLTVQGTSCSFIINAEVDSPSPMTVYTNTTDPSFGEWNGEVEVVVVGGLPDYSYSINAGMSYQALPGFYDLNEGTYMGLIEDAGGCLQPFEFTLTDNTFCTVDVSASPGSPTLCFGSCEGSVSYSFTDAYEHMPYSVELLQNGLTIQGASYNSENGAGIFSNVCAGTYVVQITDGLGCVDVSSVIITTPSQLSITAITTTNSDPGADNGTATIGATGGQAPYQYSLDGTNFFTTALFTDLAPGLHVSYLKDDNGCITEYPFVIDKNSGCDFNISMTADPASCAGSCDGSIAYAFNGTLSDTPFSIVLENGTDIIETDVDPAENVSGSFTGLCPGTYVLTVGNASGCKQLAVAVIEQPLLLTLLATTETASTGNSDGEILLNATGGTAPYQFSIDNQASWQSSPVFSGIEAGTYVAWVTDTSGCFAYYTVEVEDTSSCSFIINITTSEPLCLNNCNGTLACTFLDPAVNPVYEMLLYKGTTLLDTGGTYTDFSGLHEFTGLCAGYYTVVVTDGSGCADAQNVYLQGPDYLQVTDTDVVDATPGNSDGAVQFAVSGGTAPYEFTIDGTATWQDENVFNDLAAGYYVLMVQDANGCVFIHSFAVNEQPGCTINTTFTLTQPISCYDSCDAVIQWGYSEAVNTPPYVVELMMYSGMIETYTYAPNSGSGIWDTLCQGVYSISVTNGNGCKAFMPTLTITLPPDVSLSGTVTDASAGVANGAIELTSTGGTGQYMYSMDDVIYQESPSFENFAPGTYLAYVLDENNCSDTLYFDIIENPACEIGLSVLADAMLSCPGDCSGNISYDYDDLNFNPPYAITLTNSSGAVIATEIESTSAGVGLFTGLCAGVYEVAVTDASGCQSAAVAATIGQPSYLDVAVDVVHPSDGFYNGSITFNPSGGTPPYEYSNNNQVSWSSTNTWSFLAAGFYFIYVKDANGCIQVICVVLSEGFASATELSAAVSVYPNPTQGMVFISASSIQSVSAYDMGGQRVTLPETVVSNGVAVDLSGFSDGMYVLEITTLDGEVLRTPVVKN